MYKIQRYRTAKTFLESISPLNDSFTENFRSYIFRGQGDSKWGLLPSIFRSSTPIPYKGLRRGPMSTFGAQREMEWDVLCAFIKEANANGFHFPDEQVIYRVLGGWSNIQEGNRILRHETVWPDVEYLSLLALAQHYGLPTRLLDWSYNSYVAAFFAAKQCIAELESGKKVKNLSVFALNPNWSEFKELSELPKVHEEIYNAGKASVEFQVVTPPTYFNAHLMAQKGVFTCQHEFGNIKNYDFTPICLKEFIKLSEIKANENNDIDGNDTFRKMSAMVSRINGTVLYEYTLPSSKARELLHYLDKLGVNSSSLFPSLDGCIGTLYDRV